MAELADAQRSGRCESNLVEVQLLLPAPSTPSSPTPKLLLTRSFLFVIIHTRRGGPPPFGALCAGIHGSWKHSSFSSHLVALFLFFQ